MVAEAEAEAEVVLVMGAELVEDSTAMVNEVQEVEEIVVPVMVAVETVVVALPLEEEGDEVLRLRWKYSRECSLASTSAQA